MNVGEGVGAGEAVCCTNGGRVGEPEPTGDIGRSGRTWRIRQVDRRRATDEQETSQQGDREHDSAAPAAATRLDDHRTTAIRVDLVGERQALMAAAAEGGAGGVAPTTIRTDQDRFPMRARTRLGRSSMTISSPGSFQWAAATPLMRGMISRL